MKAREFEKNLMRVGMFPNILIYQRQDGRNRNRK